jgi:hypothetical protein
MLASATTDKVYTSPTTKLVRFFEMSRDDWKAKCRTTKVRLKRHKQRIQRLEQSREKWKQRVTDLEAEVARLTAREHALEQTVAVLKNEESAASVPWSPAGWALVAYRHTYPIGCVALFLGLVMEAAASLQCAERVLEIVGAALGLPLPTPTWCAGRLWLLRLGYYKLTRPKVIAEDWVWIIDHTVQIGADKFLVILGLRLCDLPSVGRSVSHADVETLELLPVKHSNGDVVYEQLEAAVQKTGVPREIISDHGTDLQAGIRQFCQQHPQTSAIYDIKHKTAAILKRELAQDAAWVAFTRLASQTKLQVQQTDLAALAPPDQKTKARYMNVESLVRWGRAVLAWLDQAPTQANPLFVVEHVQRKLDWVRRFRSQLEDWGELFELVSRTESFVRQQGLYPEAQVDLEKCLAHVARTDRGQQVRRNLVAFVAEEQAHARPNERLLGSSEVIESVLGKMKRLEQNQAKSGFTGLVLGISAMVSTTTQEIIHQALETVSTQQVLAWCKEKFGRSVQSKRQEVLAALSEAEQKRAPLAEGT